MSEKPDVIVGKTGIVMNYRQAVSHIQPRFVILKFPGYSNRKEAAKLLSHTVAWETVTGKIIKGKITRIHGNSGAVCAHFKEGGLPGQSFGTAIKIVK